MLALVPTLAVIAAGGTVPARAQTDPPVSVQQSPPTTDLVSALLQQLLPPPTTAPPPPGATAATPSSPVPDTAPSPTPSNPAPAPAPGDQTIPPEAIPVINSVVRSGTNNSNELLAALRRLTDRGMTLEEAALIGFGQFPVAGEAWWSDDFYHPRFTPSFHLHQGTDLFAARGTPVRAPEGGSLTYQSEGAGGLAAYVTTADGTWYYMAHLDSFARDLYSGATVKQGQVVGFVGDTGNAIGGAPHLHFEIRPRGGAAINPKPVLDRWLAEAIANVPKLMGQYEIALPRPLSTAGILRRLDMGSFGGPTVSDGPRLWMASLKRADGGPRLTSAGASGGGDPRRSALLARDAEALAVERVRAEQVSREVLRALTPRVLTGILSGAGRGGSG